jgi:signal transduction histidine kinase
LIRRLNAKSAIFLPLSANSDVFGAMGLLRSSGRPFEADDLTFIQRISSYAALAIRNARLYARASDAIQARDEVLRVVSHDLRNPVNNIQLSAQLLATPSIPDEKRKDIIQAISRSAARISGLIEDLIAISRMREGQKLPLHIRPEDPAEIIDEVCAGVGFQAVARSIHLKCNKPPAVPRINADRRRVLQVLYNILDNALKFTPEGGSIVVSCDACDAGVQFSVNDTGRGIDAKDLNKLFDLFWQAKPGAHLGSGLGLAIAKAIVEQHNGLIRAESEPGVGTTISFVLPQADVKEEPASRKVA